MNKVLKWLDSLLKMTVTLLMFIIVVIVSWQVFSRYVLHIPSSVSEELARFVLIWIGMLGGVYAYRTKSHLGLNIITNKLSAIHQRIAALFSHCMVMLFAFSVLIIGGIKIVNLTLNPIQFSAALEVKIAIVYSVIPISGLLFCCYAMVEFIETLKEQRGEK